MKLTVHTERGSYSSKEQALSEDQAADARTLIQRCASDGNYFTLDTPTGYVVLGADLLKTAAFVVEN